MEAEIKRTEIECDSKMSNVQTNMEFPNPAIAKESTK